MNQSAVWVDALCFPDSCRVYCPKKASVAQSPLRGNARIILWGWSDDSDALSTKIANLHFLLCPICSTGPGTRTKTARHFRR